MKNKQTNKQPQTKPTNKNHFPYIPEVYFHLILRIFFPFFQLFWFHKMQFTQTKYTKPMYAHTALPLRPEYATWHVTPRSALPRVCHSLSHLFWLLSFFMLVPGVILPAVPLLVTFVRLKSNWAVEHFMNEYKLRLDGTCKRIQRTRKTLFEHWHVFKRAAKQFSLPVIPSTQTNQTRTIKQKHAWNKCSKSYIQIFICF